MRHENFSGAAVGEAFEAIEGMILPSLTLLIDQASAAETGADAVRNASELRALAAELARLTALFGDRAIPAQSRSAPDPFSTDA